MSNQLNDQDILGLFTQVYKAIEESSPRLEFVGDYCLQKPELEKLADMLGLDHEKTGTSEVTKEDIEKVKNKRPRTKKVYQYDLVGNLVDTYESLKQASTNTHYNYGCIMSVCGGRSKTYKGFIWSYSKDPLYS